MITGEECGPNFLTFVLRLRENPGRNLNPKTDPIEDGTRDRCVRGNDVTPRPIIAVRNKVQPDSLQNSDLCERVLKGNLVWIYVQSEERQGRRIWIRKLCFGLYVGTVRDICISVESQCAMHNSGAREKGGRSNTDQCGAGDLELRKYSKTNPCFVIFADIPLPQ